MKKRILVSCFICVLLILGSFCASAPHSAYAAESYDVVRTTENLGAQKKGTLNITSVTLYKGESVVLEVNGLPEGSTVSFTSSSKKKASVDAKTGRIKALKKGSATITASVSVPSGYGHDAYSYTLKCKVKVKNGSAKSISSLAQLKSVLTNGKGGRYKLTADISGLTHITIPSGTYRLNLNGHKISGKSAAADGSLIEVAGGDLIITDTKGNGSIVNEDSQDAVSATKGNLSIYGGTFKGGNHALYLEWNGNVTIYGGTFKAQTRSLSLEGGTLTIYGGSFTQADEPSPFYSAYVVWVNAVYYDTPLKLTINGGHFYTSTTATMLVEGNYADVTINGGYFEAKDDDVFIQSGGTTVINGGTFYFPKEDGQAFSISNFAKKTSFTMNGGTIISEKAGYFIIQGNPEVSIKGGTFLKKHLDYNHWSYAVWIYEDFKGRLDLVNGLFEEDEVEDETPAGQGVDVFEFTRNSTTYKEGMTVTTPDDLYSMYMDAVEKLTPSISFTCSEKLFALMDFYYNKWCEGFADTHLNSEVDYGDGSETDVPVEVTLTINEYTLAYQLECLCKNKEAEKNADKEAIGYNKKIDSIIKATIKKGMTDSQKAIAIHDYMVKNYEYDYTFAKESYSIAGLLDNNLGVCQAYAGLFKILCERAGLECYLVTGMGGDEGAIGLHMWNCLYVDGKLKYMDVTFDDSSRTTKWCLKDEDEFYGLGKHYLLQ